MGEGAGRLAAKTRNPGQAAEARKLLEKVKAAPKG
jgi:hypothetical protein